MKNYLYLSALSLALASPAVFAQDTAATLPVLEEKETAEEGQKVEHIHHSDAGGSIDEVRVGGETKSITVKPAHNMPSYEIMPEQRNTPDNTGSGGQRVWKVFKF